MASRIVKHHEAVGSAARVRHGDADEGGGVKSRPIRGAEAVQAEAAANDALLTLTSSVCPGVRRSSVRHQTSPIMPAN